MSLINEALKQAGRSQKIALAGAHAGAAGGMRPAEEEAPARKPSILLPLTMVVVLATSGWFIWQWWKARGTGQPFNIASQFTGVVNKVKSLASANSGTDSAEAAPAASGSSTSGTEAKPGNAISRLFNKGAAPASPTGFPKLKLQGVYYRVGDSTALINGKNVIEGAEIDGVTVTKIDRQSVELQYQGETRVLWIH